MKRTNDPAIVVKDLYKTFRLPHEQHSGIKQKIVNIFNTNKGYEEQKVLKGISFEIEKGDFFGIVGRNGSGKSTLLKLLGGIYTPDKGLVHINGSLTPFIELGVGFNPELTGRENIFLNGALLGFDHKQMENMYDDIVKFAELEKFMDQKLKNYSSGMQVRLAFSIAIRADSDILLLDEVLAVGDEAFQRKCYQYFAELKKRKKTVILVTHDMGSVQRFCNKAMLIKEGNIVEIGNPAKVAEAYVELNNEKTTPRKNEQKKKSNDYGIVVNSKMQKTAESLVFDIEISTKTQIDDAVVTFMMNRDSGEAVYRWASDDAVSPNITMQENNTFRLHLELDNIFPDGEFDVQLAIKKSDRSVVYGLFNKTLTFRIVNPNIKKRDVHWKPKEKFSYEQD